MKRFSKALAAIMLTTAVFFAAGCKPENEPSGGSTGHTDDYEWVDLGLPSGTLWATCNLGAYGKPENYGNFFAWSNTTLMALFNWSAHWYSNGNTNELTKYCSQSYDGFNGYVDTLTVLQPNDDAATAHWGEGWRMPTKAEWDELRNKSSFTWTEVNGVNGGLFTGPNGNTIFLPAAGLRCEGTEPHQEGSTQFNVGIEGFYWSSSLSISDPISAWVFDFYSDGCYINWQDRYLGLSIRPVRSAR